MMRPKYEGDFMKIRYIPLIGIALITVLTFFSCEAIFTHSYAKPFTRDTSALLKNKSTSDLVKIAKKEATQNPALAKEILNSLAGKSDSEILALSPDEKNDILNLAIIAAVDTKALTSMLNDLDDNNSDGMTMESIFNAFDTSTNLGAVETILKNDPDKLEPTTVAFATAALIADVVEDLEEDNKDQFLEMLGKEEPKEDPTYKGLDDAEKDRVDTILGAMDSLEGREDDIAIPGLNIKNLLGGK